MKTIPLSKGLLSIVDDEDFEELNKYIWYAIYHRGKIYAARCCIIKNGKRGKILMHRSIMQIGSGNFIEHINKIGTDNRKENLKISMINKKKGVEKYCEICGTIFYTKPHLVSGSKYCSRKCSNIAKQGKHSSINTEFKMGMKPKNYNGGISICKGYILEKCPSHPRASSNGYVSQHILIWEQTNKKLLPKGWCVHHYNGNKSDNRPENLVGMPRKDHHPNLFPNLLKEKIQELESKYNQLELKYNDLLSNYKILKDDTNKRK